MLTLINHALHRKFPKALHFMNDSYRQEKKMNKSSLIKHEFRLCKRPFAVCTMDRDGGQGRDSPMFKNYS
jgi:hypothetical protein